LDQFCIAQIDNAAQAGAEISQSFHRIKTRGIAAHSEVNLFPVMYQPGKVTGSQTRIEKTIKPWRPLQRHSFQHSLNPNNPFPIKVETKRCSNPRLGPVSSDQKTSSYPTSVAFILQANDCFLA